MIAASSAEAALEIVEYLYEVDEHRYFTRGCDEVMDTVVTTLNAQASR